MGLFGIGDGKMDLQLKSANVTPGGTLEGTASLTLNKDVKGKSVIAVLFAEQQERFIGPRGQPETRTIKVYSKTENLDGEKLYTKANGAYDYKFNFVVPQTGPSATRSPSAAVGAMEMLAGGLAMGGFGGGMSMVRWYVKVELIHDAMLSFPIAKTQEINIVLGQQAQPGVR
jgi:hypothetical protein